MPVRLINGFLCLTTLVCAEASWAQSRVAQPLESEAAIANAFTVGYLSGEANSPEAMAGDIVAPLVDAVATNQNTEVLTSSTLDTAFFDQIDLFVFANAAGGFTYRLGAEKRANLLSFVNNGGIAYLGLDLLEDGVDIASDFGWSLADRNTQVGNIGTIIASDHVITTGPFQPATTFVMNWHGRFVGPVPPGGVILGENAYGDALTYREFGQGQVYIYSDEVPLISGTNDHYALFNNMVFDAINIFKDSFEALESK